MSPVLLGRARSIAAEHADLSKQLAQNYDNEIAKRAGELSTTARALQEWETANDVGKLFPVRISQANFISVSV